MSNANTQGTLSPKEEILARVRESIACNSHIPSIKEGEPRFSQPLHLSGEGKEALLQDFTLNHTNNKSLIIESSKGDLPRTIAKILAENDSEISASASNGGASSGASAGENLFEILCNCDLDCELEAVQNALKQANLQSYALLPYTQSVDSMRDRLFGISASIVQARCGIADLGVIALSSNENAPRLSSLITNICIYLLDKNHIVPNMLEGIKFAKEYERKRSGSEILPSNIILVAGPSRTADIELQTVFGVHGPRKTYTVLY
ncbi:LutC/YkgG family protein [Helicobacter macacae]|uniref:LUD domain-containing protein n=1 Tax=Helicobacter macacae MIT 99-5501 TaxID=1357400 RepID=V8C7L7_9HELI|nr:LUD domain-containing protein [Helicobacter macacae]ETD23005.1 hypothetical protein HMPREF2086_01452 [Helicobacter macacae MIT 99-5501]